MIPIGSTVEFGQSLRSGRGTVVVWNDRLGYGVQVTESVSDSLTPLHTLNRLLETPTGWWVQPQNIARIVPPVLTAFEQSVIDYCDKELGRSTS